MIVCVAGSRGYTNWVEFNKQMDVIADETPITMIVHGDCPKSPDKMAHRWAGKNHVRRQAIPADWTTHGKAAGPIRNQVLCNMADVLVAFWDGKSNGTKDIIGKFRKAKLKVIIVKVKL